MRPAEDLKAQKFAVGNIGPANYFAVRAQFLDVELAYERAKAKLAAK
jgi:hypothetical protein